MPKDLETAIIRTGESLTTLKPLHNFERPNMALFVNDCGLPTKIEKNVKDIRGNQHNLEKEKSCTVDKNNMVLSLDDWNFSETAISQKVFPSMWSPILYNTPKG